MKTIAKRILSKKNTQNSAEDENSNEECILPIQQQHKVIVEQPSEEDKTQSQAIQTQKETKDNELQS